MGRNTVYLAQHGFEVHAIDFVQGNIDALRVAAAEAGVSERVHGHTQSVTQRWPLESKAASVIIDTFCYKHQIDDEERASYRHELARVLKPGGYYLLTLAGRDDGYYGPLLAKADDPAGRVIIDPANGIRSVLFDRQDVEQEFAGVVRFLVHRHKRRTGEMHGAAYERSTHLFIGIREQG
jgi:SAM-dependent methyltransferase